MIMDAQNRPSNQQSLAVAAGTTVSTDSIDLLVAHANPGRSGGGLRAVALVSVALTGGTNVQAQLIQSANANLSSPDVLASGLVIADAAAVAGKVLLDVPLPDTTKRYIGFQYVTTGVHTTGMVTAGIVGGTNALVGNIPMQLGTGGTS
jgi:hypothetical protein